MIASNTNTKSLERRRHRRWGYNVRLQGIHIDSAGRRVIEDFRAVDISDSGLGVISHHNHAAGQEFVFCLPNCCGRRFVHAMVVRSRTDRVGHHLGLEFRPLPDNLANRLDVPVRAAA